MNLKKEDKFLLDCIKLDQNALSRLQQITHTEWEAIFQKSTKHFLAPFLYRVLSGLKKEIDIPVYLLDKLHQTFLSNTVRNVRTFYALSKALKQLKKSGIPFILLKGAHLSELVYEDSGLRMMEDIDILFKKEDLKRAQLCLITSGYFNKNSQLILDIHWYIEQYLDLDMEKIWGTAQPAEIAGVNALVLSPEDLIVHLCMHLSFHHQFQFAGLRGLCDIKETIKHYDSQINWGKVKSRAEEWRVRNGVYLSLLLSRDLTGAKIPDDALENLKPEIYKDEFRELAIKRIFQHDAESEHSLSPYFWQIWYSNSFFTKILCLSKLLLPSRQFISQKYPNSIKTKNKFYYYFIRMNDHFKRYFNMTWRILIQEESTMRLFEEKKKTYTMIEWITADNKLL